MLGAKRVEIRILQASSPVNTFFCGDGRLSLTHSLLVAVLLRFAAAFS